MTMPACEPAFFVAEFDINAPFLNSVYNGTLIICKICVDT